MTRDKRGFHCPGSASRNGGSLEVNQIVKDPWTNRLALYIIIPSSITKPRSIIKSFWSLLTPSFKQIYMALALALALCKRQRRVSLLLLLFVLCLAVQESSRAEARPIPFQHQLSYSRTLATLGLVCKCCDGVGGDSGGEESCTASWKGSCSKLHCLPWKLQ